jgi:hypothetical protein
MNTYLIHSAVRGRANRTLRQAAPQHARLVQYIGPRQLRLVRGRPLTLTEEELLGCLTELQSKVTQGLIEVTTADRRPFNLQTLTAAAPSVAPPKPIVVLDSVKNDKQDVGEVKSQFPGGKTEMEVTIPKEFLPEPSEEEDLELLSEED